MFVFSNLKFNTQIFQLLLNLKIFLILCSEFLILKKNADTTISCTTH